MDDRPPDDLRMACARRTCIRTHAYAGWKMALTHRQQSNWDGYRVRALSLHTSEQQARTVLCLVTPSCSSSRSPSSSLPPLAPGSGARPPAIGMRPTSAPDRAFLVASSVCTSRPARKVIAADPSLAGLVPRAFGSFWTPGDAPVADMADILMREVPESFFAVADMCSVVGGNHVPANGRNSRRARRGAFSAAGYVCICSRLCVRQLILGTHRHEIMFCVCPAVLLGASGGASGGTRGGKCLPPCPPMPLWQRQCFLRGVSAAAAKHPKL